MTLCRRRRFRRSLSLSKGGFEHTYGSISHAQRFRLFIRTHEAIATAIKQYKCMHGGKKKDEKPTAISFACVRILPSRVLQLAFISDNMSAHHTLRTLCIPSPRDATRTQLQSTDTLVYPSFAHSRVLVLVHTHTHSHAHDIHSNCRDTHLA